MQPHSMCALSIANYFWNYPHLEKVKSCTMSVEYRNKDGLFCNLYYKITDIQVSDDNKEIKLRTERQGSGDSCGLTISRSSVSEGSEFRVEHTTRHAAGVYETCNMYKNNLKGRVVNSRRYGNYKGDISGPKSLNIACELYTDSGRTLDSTYKLEWK